MEPAPFHADLAEGPPGGRAVFARAEDGVRLRLGLWPGTDASAGTIFVFPGRCEYIEKYGRTARTITGRGPAVLAIDWRGQGLSDRLLPNRFTGHVRRFRDYQMDVAQAVSFARAEDLPRPWLMLAHSMGGAIGLRTLAEGAEFAAAAFSAPMWGIAMAPTLRRPARILPWIAGGLGQGGRVTPTTKPASYFADTPFDENELTTDPDMWAYMAHQADKVADFRLGGPSLTWLGESLAETRALAGLPRPDIPAHASVGTREKIVDPGAVSAVMQAWSGGTFTLVDDAEHELLMERSEIRGPFLDRVFGAFARAV